MYIKNNEWGPNFNIKSSSLHNNEVNVKHRENINILLMSQQPYNSGNIILSCYLDALIKELVFRV